jgi:hypothetical protein
MNLETRLGGERGMGIERLGMERLGMRYLPSGMFGNGNIWHAA